MDLEALNTIDNPEKSRFELNDGDELLAFIDYKVGKSGNWYLIHTEVVSNREKGIGRKIVTDVLAMLDQKGEKIVPSCPYIKAYIKKNTNQYMHMLADGVKLDD